MEPEKQDEGKQDKVIPIFRTVFKTSVTAVAILIASGIYATHVEPWWQNRKWRSIAIKETGLSSKQVDKYYARGIKFWDLEDFGRVNPQALDALLTDPEVLERAQRKTVIKDNDKLRRNICDLVVDIGRDRETFVNDYYLPAHLNNKGGAYTTLAGYDYGVGLEDFLKIPEPNTVNFSVLSKHRIPVEYSVPRLQNGHKVEEIIEKYAMEMCGVSADLRLKYLSIKLPDFRMLSDTEISSLAKSGMKPEYFEEIITANAKEGDLNRNKVYYLIIGGKLNGDIYVKWRQAEIGPDDIICALEWDYSLPLVKEVNSRGKGVKQFHEDLLYHKLLSDVVEQRKVPSQ